MIRIMTDKNMAVSEIMGTYAKAPGEKDAHTLPPDSHENPYRATGMTGSRTATAQPANITPAANPSNTFMGSFEATLRGFGLSPRQFLLTAAAGGLIIVLLRA